MAAKSDIEWTNSSWNPLRGAKGRWFCTKVDQLCKNCYSESLNHRFRGPDFAVGNDTLRLDQKILLDPLRWRSPRKIFVCSMTDLFHETVPYEWHEEIFKVIAARGDHTFQVLTKRQERMAAFTAVHPVLAAYPKARTLANVWWGCSVGDRVSAKKRIPVLQGIDVPVRWLSIEPLLEDLGPLDLKGISWVVVGCESGHHARPMEIDWVRSIRDQCLESGTAFFFKQAMVGGKVVGRPEIDGRQWLEFPNQKAVSA